MAKKCPNTNDKQWKSMVAHVGEFEAYRAYIAHDHTIPNALTLSELKRTIGLQKGPFSPERQIGINKRIRAFNKKNGTSHRIVYRRIGETNSYAADLQLNYIPVNLQRQADRDLRRKMIGYTNLEDKEGGQKLFIPSEAEAEAGHYDNEGQFLPPSAYPAAVSEAKRPKFQSVIDERKEELNVLFKDLYKFKDLQEEAVNRDQTEKAVKLSKKVAVLSNRITEVRKQINDLEDLNNLDEIEKYVKEDMGKLERLFKKAKPSPSDLQHAARIIHVWQQAGDFSGDNQHIFYDPGEYDIKDEGLKEITMKFVEWAHMADDYEGKLIAHEKRILYEKVEETVGKGVEFDLDAPLKDVNFMTKNLLDITELENVVLQVTGEWVKKANWAANKEMKGITKDVDRLIKATGLKNFNMFRQTFSNTDQRKTGDMVHRFSQKFFDWLQKTDQERENTTEQMRSKDVKTSDPAKIAIKNAQYIANMRMNSEVFDANILFHDPDYTDAPAPTDDQIAREEDKLRSLLGDKGYDEFFEENRKQIERYKLDRDSQMDYYFSHNPNNQQLAEGLLASWEGDHSPYMMAEFMKEGFVEKIHKGVPMTPMGDYVTVVPKGKVEGVEYYDSKFKQIESTPSYLALHEYMTSTIQKVKNYLPSEKVKFMQMNSIPWVSKKTIEAIFDGGVQSAFREMADDLKENLRMDDLSTVAGEEEKKEHQFHLLTNHTKTINDYVELMSLQFSAREGRSPTEDEKDEFRKDKINTLAEEKSFDLGRVVKAFSSMAVTYKHRASVEDSIRIVRDIMQRAVEQRENVAGEPLRSRWGKLLGKDGLDNTWEMLEDFLDQAYWGYPTNIPEGKTKMKVLTSQEKIVRDNIDKAREAVEQLWAGGGPNKKIDRETYEGKIASLDEQLEALGGVRVTSKVGDMILKYIQLKGMGWNVFAAGSNIGFGILSNTIEASDGRNYSMKSFRRAMALTLNSVARNATFNRWDGINGQAKKIRALMNYFDTLKESKNEIYRFDGAASLFKKVGKGFEWLKPFNLQSRSEYINQAPVMIAMMMETKVKVDGKEMSVWDAYSVNEEGDPVFPKGTDFESVFNREDYEKLSEERKAELNEIGEFKLKQRIDKMIKLNHGNYDPDTPLAGKRKIFGRMLMQFRTWALQGFHERFGKYKVDTQLIDRRTGAEFLERKGRYRSYLAYYKSSSGIVGGMKDTFNLVYQLLRKAAWQKTTFQGMADEGEREGFTDVDAANMRKNMTEIMLWLMLLATTLLMKLGSDDDDDDDKKLAYFFLINQVGRINTDIWFYTSPLAFERLTRNAIPAFSLVTDAAKVGQDIIRIIGGGEDILQSGPNKGKSRLLRDLGRIAPGTVQLGKLRSATAQEFKKEK